jgi:putative DNA primase/helicase
MVPTFNERDESAPLYSLAGLLPHHLAELRASGLSDETIKAAGICSETRYTALAAMLGWRRYPKKMAPAIVFPFTDDDGRKGFARIKPDRPRVLGGKGGRPVKYESPRGQPNRIYLPPGVASKLREAGGELLITEGEKKALKATQEGFACIGLVGVWGWKDAKSERLLAELERVVWQGRPVSIVFDSDIARNEQVRDAEARLAAILTSRGASVRVVRLPDGPIDADGKPAKMGLDDFLVAHGPGELRKLLDNADEPEPPDPVSMQGDARALDPASEATAFLETEKTDGISRLRFWRGGFWRWNAGRYEDLASPELRASVIQFLNRSHRNLTSAITTNVVDQVKAQSILAGAAEPPTWLGQRPMLDAQMPWPAADVVVAKNGLIHLPSLVEGRAHFHAPTPRYFTTVALDYEFAIDAPEPVEWRRFLDELWPDDRWSIETLQEWFGLSLVLDTRYQKILMLLGPMRSGKGTIARVQGGLVGRQNVAAPTLASLSQNFGLWPLIGKSLAIISDARLSGRADQAVVVERLLSISGEDTLTIDGKYREPWTGKLTTRLMILTNELPRLGDSSGALPGRMILLRLTKSFYGCEDHGLTDRLLTELPGILSWSIAGWQRLRERGHFKQPDSGRELVGELNDLSSPIKAFIAERCVVGPEYSAAIQDLFAEWGAWCAENGRDHPGTRQTFGRDLRAAVPTISDSQHRDGERRLRSYEGIGLRS